MKRKFTGHIMPLAEIWKATPGTILGMNISAILNIATNGDRLKDGSDGAREFREFLAQIDAKKLADFAVYCVENSFQDSGQVLQDLVNEMGRRLGFKAENGRYQGVRNDIGFDGIWSDPDGSIVIEVYMIRNENSVRWKNNLRLIYWIAFGVLTFLYGSIFLFITIDIMN